MRDAAATALAAVSVGVRVADYGRTLPQLSAVTVAQDTALQTRLGAQLAHHLAGATTGYQRLDELSICPLQRGLPTNGEPNTWADHPYGKRSRYLETMELRSSMSIVVMIMDREIITYTNGLEESGSREYL